MSAKEKDHLYRVDLTWNEGRIGTMSSPELDDRIEVATPPQFDGGVEGIWSPEHLFVSSVSSCFMTTFVAIAQYSKLDFEDLDVKAEGKIEKVDGKFMVTEITLAPELVIAEEKFQDKAMRILEKAEGACLITRSIKTKIHFDPKVTVASMK
ncbi:OsmC family peroxiredoxin [Balneolaceae bacterium YR4-1]|uniref:OsmC family peroxiredoxin n=1 Tax=Halalkalibaculum roseum TaxID=2709311 RepID=A0A6M1SWT3_9BACT|nr:OsmC family protein [Halalkalibaculum roseum]NGP77520.1 OsmC family peroxiredoxin [Halalkalibaculum roseum]